MAVASSLEEHLQSTMAAGPAIRKPASEELPLRLIDVVATLNAANGNIFLKAPTGWDFHVISHTWGRSIKDLSAKIGQQIGEAGADAYNEAFERANLSCDLCYKQLMELCKLLAGDGVKAIWLDFLCINQTDGKEKSREIRNMGAYYRQSLGCYVLVHGLGQGYELWHGKRGEEVPRLFTRVWTFQEFLLPRRLVVIVEGLDAKFIAAVNGLIMAEGKKGLCRCFLRMESKQIHRSLEGSVIGFELRPELSEDTADDDWFHSGQDPGLDLREQDIRVTEYLNANDSWASNPMNSTLRVNPAPSWSSNPHWPTEEVLSSKDQCSKCLSLPMIRKAEAKGIYFVDREAYLGVVQSDCFMEEEGLESQMQLPYMVRCPKGVEKLRGLYVNMLQRCHKVWMPRYVVSEVRVRDCKIEEDRVLGILGLLGVEMPQLRTGRHLKEQVVELAKVCSREFLVDLCIMDSNGCGIDGMSWAPEFQQRSRESLDYPLDRLLGDSFTVEVERPQVADSGRIKLLARVAYGRVLPKSVLMKTLKNRKKFHRSSIAGSSHFIAVPLPLELARSLPSQEKIFDGALLIPLHRVRPSSASHDGSICFECSTCYLGNWFDGGIEVPILDKLDTQGASSPRSTVNLCFPVRLVLLATGKVFDASQHSWSDPLKLIMVCLSATISSGPDEQQGEELHKIGVIKLDSGTEDDESPSAIELVRLFAETPIRECVIGGFGADLSEYVDVLTEDESEDDIEEGSEQGSKDDSEEQFEEGGIKLKDNEPEEGFEEGDIIPKDEFEEGGIIRRSKDDSKEGFKDDSKEGFEEDDIRPKDGFEEGGIRPSESLIDRSEEGFEEGDIKLMGDIVLWGRKYLFAAILAGATMLWILFKWLDWSI